METTTEAGHIDKWAEGHWETVEDFVGIIKDKNNKAIFIRGPVHSGKTSLAAAAARNMAKSGEPVEAFFTTPAIQQNLDSQPSLDRTGVKFSKLPGSQTIQEGAMTLIVVDEIDQRSPNPDLWNKYINKPGTKFVFLSHPGGEKTKEWENMFNKDNTVSLEMTAEPAGV